MSLSLTEKKWSSQGTFGSWNLVPFLPSPVIYHFRIIKSTIQNNGFIIIAQVKANARKTRKNGSKSPEITAMIEALSNDEECNEAPSNTVEVAIHDVTDIRFQLPSPNWSQMEPCETESHVLYCVETIVVDGCPVIRKWAKIDFHFRRVEAGLFKNLCPQMVEDFISLETVNQALKRIHSASQCCGISTEPSSQNGKEVIFINGAWRSSTSVLFC